MLKQKATISNRCVACGTCVLVCPKQALSIPTGIKAIVSDDCVGCTLCAKVCPAGVITMTQKEVQA